jgi:hypothetical protein
LVVALDLLQFQEIFQHFLHVLELFWTRGKQIKLVNLLHENQIVVFNEGAQILQSLTIFSQKSEPALFFLVFTTTFENFSQFLFGKFKELHFEPLSSVLTGRLGDRYDRHILVIAFRLISVGYRLNLLSA